MAELKYTKHLLSKIEDIFKEIEYTIRYAKGSFQSGYCLVEQQKVVVVNKYYETEGRINVLMDILDNLTIEESTLTEKCLKTYKQVMKKKQEEASEETPENPDASKEVSEETPDNADALKEVSEEIPDNADVSKEVSEEIPETVDASKEVNEETLKKADQKEETVVQNGEVDEL